MVKEFLLFVSRLLKTPKEMIEDASFDKLMVNTLLIIDNLKHIIFKEWSPLFKFPEVFFPLITTVSSLFHSYNLQNNAKRVGTEMVLMPLY